MKIVVKLNAVTADALGPAAANPAAANNLVSVMKRWAIHLSPVHAGSAGNELRTYFTAEIPNVSAPEIQQELLETSGVEAAYFKPPDAMP